VVTSSRPRRLILVVILLRPSETATFRTEATLEISLEHIASLPIPNTFRVAFHSAAERCLLPYPSVTGLTFTDGSGTKIGEWGTRLLVSEPMDDFVLNPRDRISFDLDAGINADDRSHRWVIDLPVGTYDVRFVYRVDRESDWYDFLAKRSRFAALTPIWRGSVQSNTIRFTVIDAEREDAK
jgi:hypothetical protein